MRRTHFGRRTPARFLHVVCRRVKHKLNTEILWKWFELKARARRYAITNLLRLFPRWKVFYKILKSGIISTSGIVGLIGHRPTAVGRIIISASPDEQRNT